MSTLNSHVSSKSSQIFYLKIVMTNNEEKTTKVPRCSMLKMTILGYCYDLVANNVERMTI
jgi:hypothetical protein